MDCMKYIVGNWKMHLGIRESVALARGILRAQRGREVAPTTVICPSFLALAEVHKVLARSRVMLGAQNCGFDRSGAYTGEVSTAMLEEVSCSHVIIGHSERRELFDESDAVIAKRFLSALNSKVVPILCVGETAEVRKDKKELTYVKKQLDSVLNGISSFSKKKELFIAYEPVWAIGSKNPAEIEDVLRMHKAIRAHVAKKLSLSESQVKVLYGGSVDGKNAYSFLREDGIDGLLVGGASIKLHEFSHILESAFDVMEAQQS